MFGPRTPQAEGVGNKETLSCAAAAAAAAACVALLLLLSGADNLPT